MLWLHFKMLCETSTVFYQRKAFVCKKHFFWHVRDQSDAYSPFFIDFLSKDFAWAHSLYMLADPNDALLPTFAHMQATALIHSKCRYSTAHWIFKTKTWIHFKRKSFKLFCNFGGQILKICILDDIKTIESNVFILKFNNI